MRRIYIVRHGKPDMGDGGKRYIGITDLPLSPDGKKQAERMGGWLARKNIREIYSSPLRRCRETAGIIRKAGKYPRTVLLRDDLREMSMGSWENRTFSDIKANYPQEYKERGANPGYYKIPGGETFREAGERMEKCVNKIRESQGNIVIVAHAGAVRGYLCRLLGKSPDEVMSLPQAYGSVTILEETDDAFSGTPKGIRIGWKPYSLLGDEEIEGIYKACGTPGPVIHHMEAVAGFIGRIKDKMSEDIQKQYNWGLLKKAALLHDIKRTGEDHARAGADFLVREGYLEIAELVRHHHDKDLSDGELTEEKILFYADKRVQEDCVVTVGQRFAESKKKCKTEEALEKHKKVYEKTIRIERIIKDITGADIF